MPSAGSRAGAGGPRIHAGLPLAEGASIDLPQAAARHVQVLRLQPGSMLTLFNGEGGEFDAVVQRMGRSDVSVQVGRHHAVEREAPREVHLAVGMPANERMDWLVEKATELGAASIQPLTAERSVLRLSPERAQKKVLHWQGIAEAACEQCGRNRVPRVHPVRTLSAWLDGMPVQGTRLVLSPAGSDQGLASLAAPGTAVVVLSGPEGGLAPSEEEAAAARGFRPVALGPRILRAETAPLAALALFALPA